MLETGKILEASGIYSEESQERYIYQYQNVVSIDEAGYFYVIAEVLADGEGVLSKTGSYYALEIYSGEFYKLWADERGSYTLIEINISPND
jgi:predicted methyltransferase